MHEVFALCRSCGYRYGYGCGYRKSHVDMWACLDEGVGALERGNDTRARGTREWAHPNVHCTAMRENHPSVLRFRAHPLRIPTSRRPHRLMHSFPFSFRRYHSPALVSLRIPESMTVSDVDPDGRTVAIDIISYPPLKRSSIELPRTWHECCRARRTWMLDHCRRCPPFRMRPGWMHHRYT